MSDDRDDDQNTEKFSSLQEGFWFNREEDEVFVGSLANRRAIEGNRASRAYAEFLATSTRLSAVSFSPHQSYNGSKGTTSTAPMHAVAIAHDLLPLMDQDPLTWSQWTFKRKFTVIATFLAVVSALAIGFFSVPVAQLNNQEASCPVASSIAFEYDCGENSPVFDGFCIEVQVSPPQSDGLVAFAVLQGFDEGFESVIDGRRINCAVTNCNNDPLLEVDADDLPEGCLAILEEENKTADDLNETEIVACSLIESNFQCVGINENDQLGKQVYFNVEFQGGTAVSVPKQPSISIVIIVTTVLALLLMGFAVASAYELRKPLYEMPSTVENDAIAPVAQYKH